MYQFDQPTMDKFIYWIKERMAIHNKRLKGEPKPWSSDWVFQSSFFTTPFRELDKTTHWFAASVRDKLQWDPTPVVFATLCFRWFNYIPTGQLLLNRVVYPLKGPDILPESDIPDDMFFSDANLLLNWDGEECRNRLKNQSRVITGAYCIKTIDYMDKLSGLIQIINPVWERRQAITESIIRGGTLERAFKEIVAPKIPFLGPFMAYEVICDLRHTCLLNDAPDIKTWCNIGPGAKRGLNRLFGKSGNAVEEPLPFDKLRIMSSLVQTVQNELDPNEYPDVEMRTIEHSLCEFDKYMRVLSGDGKSKRQFKGV